VHDQVAFYLSKPLSWLPLLLARPLPAYSFCIESSANVPVTCITLFTILPAVATTLHDDKAGHALDTLATH
jgi:hypothetical protein